MKKMAALILFLFACYSIYHDFNQGSLPAAGKDASISLPEENGMPYFEKEIHAGDTVLSIIEDTFTGTMNIPISQAIEDFKSLNNGMEPEKIQIGKIYRFPAYSRAE